MSVDISEKDIEASKCMTMEEAAEKLDMMPGRGSQLAKAGRLVALTINGRRMVTITSVEARKANPPAPHRPKKNAAVA